MSEVSREDAARTADIDYTGAATMEDWFDDLVDVFEKHGCKVEGSSDGPTDDSWYERLTRADSVILRFLRGWSPTTDNRWKRGRQVEPMTDGESAAIVAARRNASPGDPNTAALSGRDERS